MFCMGKQQRSHTVHSRKYAGKVGWERWLKISDPLPTAKNNLSLGINLLTFWLNASIVIQSKVKKCEQTLLFIAMHYWGYTSLEVKGRSGLLLPPCLLITAIQQPATFSPPSQLKCFSEGIIWMCRASFTNSSCSLPWPRTVVSWLVYVGYSLLSEMT